MLSLLVVPRVVSMLIQMQAITSLPSGLGDGFPGCKSAGLPPIMRTSDHCEFSQIAPSVAPDSAPIRIVLDVLHSRWSFLRSRYALTAAMSLTSAGRYRGVNWFCSMSVLVGFAFLMFCPLRLNGCFQNSAALTSLLLPCPRKSKSITE